MGPNMTADGRTASKGEELPRSLNSIDYADIVDET